MKELTIEDKKEIEGVSPQHDVFGLAGMWRCLFTGSCQAPKSGLPVILLGGWEDDLLCKNHHHVQRIALVEYPPLNVTQISISRKYPFRTFVDLSLQGFIASDGKFLACSEIIPYNFPEGEFIKETWKIDYHQYLLSEIFTMQFFVKKRFDMFKIIMAVWLADGRIFAENLDLVYSIVELGKHAAAESHEYGGPWKSLDKMMEK